MKIQKRKVGKIALIIGGAFLCAALGFWSHSIIQKYQSQKIATDDEVLMAVLSERIVLPQEIPSIATVTDKEKLANQPFFLSAENGDKVIIYAQAKRAYLFRPREQKIIDMTVVNVENPSSSIPVFQVNEP